MHASLDASIEALDADKAKLDADRPLPLHTLESLRDTLMLEWTYNANALEGNTLTLGETKIALEGMAVGGKTLREHFEALNHRDAIRYAEEIVGHNEALSESQIRHIHARVLKNVDDSEAGQYRRVNVKIDGASAALPDFSQLPAEMAALIDWHAHAAAMHPLVRAAQLHARFWKICPFVAGNGRIGRLLLNLELMKAGYPPAVIRNDERAAYREALDKACVAGDYDALTRFVVEAVRRTLGTYLNMLGEHD
ncbi:Fic family protein [Trinickia dinghuensis]|uniref:Fic family protein n=1 Tax=Trinickia dinghuensis TaxID=2291023 RepID=A0A3D8JX42_9BURK|nr:Fic family protein [Trinickia dinghuensis]RDU97688.1 Fic family protein [Trinickia dinghuensis]